MYFCVTKRHKSQNAVTPILFLLLAIIVQLEWISVYDIN